MKKVLLLIPILCPALAFGEVNEELQEAVEAGDISGVKKAITKGAKIDKVDTETGVFPLELAAAHDRRDVMIILLKAKANVNLRNPVVGGTALHSAKNTATIRILIEAGADVNAAGFSGLTALHYAAGTGNTETVRLLIKAKANLNAKTTPSKALLHGLTPLMMAAREGKKEVVKLLVEAGADLNAINSAGQTAASVAADEYNSEIVELLKAAARAR